MRHRLLLGACCWVLGLWAHAAAAQDLVLGPTLKGMQDRGTIRIGVRENALPFAFHNRAGQPVGFSVDLCAAIATDAAGAIGVELLDPDALAWRKGLRVTYVSLSSDQRIPAMLSGTIDLECGSTTATKERAQQVGFSPVFFLAGTKLLVAAESGIRSYRDLAGKTAVVSAGTTNGAVLRTLSARSSRFDVVDAPDFAAAARMLETGQVQAFASDDVLLAGLIANRPTLSRDRIVGDYLSFEPYAIMLPPNDPQFEVLVQGTFHRLAETSQLTSIYNRWFLGKLPNGKTLDLPMSTQLSEMYRVLGTPD